MNFDEHDTNFAFIGFAFTFYSNQLVFNEIFHNKSASIPNYASSYLPQSFDISLKYRHFISHISHLAPYALHLTPHTSHLISYTLHFTPHTNPPQSLSAKFYFITDLLLKLMALSRHQFVACLMSKWT